MEMPRSFQLLEVAGQCRPVHGHAPDDHLVRFELSLVGPGGTALAERFRRDPLAYFALGVAVFEDGEVRMRMNVDKAWRDNQAARIDIPFGRSSRHMPQSHDLRPAHGQVAEKPGVAGAIDNFAMADHDVKRRFVCRKWKRKQAKAENRNGRKCKPGEATHDGSRLVAARAPIIHGL